MGQRGQGVGREGRLTRGTAPDAPGTHPVAVGPPRCAEPRVAPEAGSAWPLDRLAAGPEHRPMAASDSTSTTSALLLTDMVGSTSLTQRLGDAAMSELWRGHDRIARDLLAPWRGREIDKTDGMLLLFACVADAVGYALALHRGIASSGLPCRVRSAIHSGPLTFRHNDAADVARGAKPLEVTGVAVATTARVMAIALGGQTLLTAPARHALGEVAHRLVTHGFWQLHGVAEPVELFEVGEGDQAPFAVPADGAKAYRVSWQGDRWQPTRELSHSLPAERDRFVGRRGDLQALARKLQAGAKLVSIVGIGGGGKTRLALRHAWEHLGDYPGGAWFCDLSQARDLHGIAFAVAQGLQLPLGQAEPVGQLAQAIAGRGRCLVILDNFEQVARLAEATLGRWIDGAPQSSFIATSREVLGIVGEQLLPLDPLPGDEAFDLFSQRAAAARHGYLPDSGDAEAIRQLVGVLDGLPLAIELAAARVRVMPPQALMARVRDRFDLIGTRAGRHDRQATLRATFDWSWDLLDDAEKAALAMLSVFEGGFTVDSAAAVLSPADGSLHDAIDAVQALVDKSFVRQTGDDRFDLLQTVHDYAARRLIAPGDFPGSGPDCAAAAQARHWRHFATLDERAAIAHRCRESNNLIAACRRAAAAGDAPSAAACLVVAWASLRLTGPYRAAVDLAQTVGALPALADRERATVLWVCGDALELLGEIESARNQLQRGLDCAQRVGDPGVSARLLIALGTRQTLDGELGQARDTLERAAALTAGPQHTALRMHALNALGLHHDHQARWQQAQGCYEQALALARSLGDRRMEGGLLGNLGGLHHDLGDLQAAQQHYDSALALASNLGDRRWEGNAHCNLGLLHQEQGRRAEARGHFETALAMAQQVGHVRLEYTVLCNLGILLGGEGRLEDAGRHLQQAVDAASACADRRAEGQFRGYLAVNLALRGRLDEARASLAAGQTLLLAMSDRLSHALLLCDRAEVEWLDRCPSAARMAIDEARRLAQALHCADSSELCRRILALDSSVAASAQA